MISGLAVDLGGINVADIVVLVILAIGAFIGLLMGFAKLLNGGAGVVLAIIIGVVCAIFLAEKASQISFLANLQNTISEKMVAWSAPTGLDATVTDKVVYVMTEEGSKSLAEIFPDGINAKLVQLLQPVLVALCGAQLTGSTTIAAAVGSLTAKVIAGVLIVIIAIILVMIIAAILSKLLSTIVVKHKGFRALDRILGIIFAAAISLIIVYAVMFVFHKLSVSPSLASVVEMIEDSSVAKWFYENNPFVILLG